MLRNDIIQPYLDAHPWPMLFVTLSGAHLYGFASPDSDYDLRGVHYMPASAICGLTTPRETYEIMDLDAEIEMDLVTHDAKKFFLMLLNKNGYVLEQIFSPIVIQSTPEHEELKEIASSASPDSTIIISRTSRRDNGKIFTNRISRQSRSCSTPTGRFLLGSI